MGFGEAEGVLGLDGTSIPPIDGLIGPMIWAVVPDEDIWGISSSSSSRRDLLDELVVIEGGLAV